MVHIVDIPDMEKEAKLISLFILNYLLHSMYNVTYGYYIFPPIIGNKFRSFANFLKNRLFQMVLFIMILTSN